MAEVLYRKYRSQTFDELIGQEHITDILKSSIKNDQISHAYLFVGSRGTGKTSSARILAKALNCTDIQKDGNPCNRCERCQAVSNGTFLDMIEIDAASNRGIDQIRELKERIEFSPTEGDYKVYIIDEVHMLTTEAFNALLKTLEEPPSHVVFILATTDVHKLPATILSRCQRYDFLLGTDEQVGSVLLQAAANENVKLSDESLKVLVQNANGSYRDALSLLDIVVSGQLDSEDPGEVSGEEVRRSLGIPDSTMVYYLLEKLSEKDGEAALDLIGELDSKGVDLQQFVKFILLSLREILVSKIDQSDNDYSFSKNLTQREVLNMINLFLEADRKLRNATIPVLVLEMVVAEIIVTGDGQSAESVPKAKEPKGKGESGKDKKEKTITAKVKKEKPDKKDETKVAKGSTAKSKRESSEKKDPDSNKDKSNSDESKEISLSEVESSWTNITKSVRKFNNHLYAFLKAAKVSSVKDGQIFLEVPFEFHKERIEAPKSREAINETLTEVLGFTLPIRCEVNETIQRKKPASADVVLKNIQSTERSTAPASKSESKIPAKRRVSKKVEAIFADI